MNPTLSLNMMVRNAASVIGRALTSLGTNFDELVVVDTGSTDGTRAAVEAWMAQHGTGRRFTFLEWNERSHPESFVRDTRASYAPEVPGPFTERLCLADWSAPRNAALDASTCDFVIHLDAEDIVCEPQKIRQVVQVLQERNLDVALIPYSYRHDQYGNTVIQHLRERVGRRSAVRWSGKIHEVLSCPDPTRVANFDGLLVADLNDCPQPDAVPHRNLKLLHNAFMSGDRDTRTLFHLAIESRQIMPSLALDVFGLYIEKAKTAGINVNRAVAHVERGKIYEANESFEIAKSEYKAALQAWPRIPEAALGFARIAFLTNRFAECVSWTNQAFEMMKIPATALIMHDPTERQARSRLFLALALANIGEHEEAMVVYDQGKDLMPAEFASLKAILDKKAATIAVREKATA